MTLQQLRYLIAIAEGGSFSEAAHNLFVSQSTLSTAIRDLENELGIRAFSRSNKGVTLTDEGVNLVSYARQIVEQSDLLTERYSRTSRSRGDRLVISTQHYAFAVESFVALANRLETNRYDRSLRETRTSEIIRDVAEFRSNLGILYLDEFNSPVISRELEANDLTFTQLFEADVHVFVGEGHPLADRSAIDPSELADYARYSFEQGVDNSFHYAEEPLSMLPHSRNITFSDRGTLTNLLTHGKGYTLSTGVLSDEMQQGIVAIPLLSNERMSVGYIMSRERRATELTLEYIKELRRCIDRSATVRTRR